MQTDLGGPGALPLDARDQKAKSRLIVMGTRGQGLVGRALIGGIAQSVVATATYLYCL